MEDVCLAGEDTVKEVQRGEETWEEWELQSTRKAKPKPKIGATSRSIANASTTFGYGTSKPKPGKGKGSGRINCGEADHWWGNCPNLQAKKAVFGKGKPKSGKVSKQKGKSAVMVAGDCPGETEGDLAEENAVGSAVAEEMGDGPEEEIWEEMEESPVYGPWVETYVICESVSWLHRNAWNVNNL